MTKMGMTFSYWYLTEVSKLEARGYAPYEANLKVLAYVEENKMLRHEWYVLPEDEPTLDCCMLVVEDFGMIEHICYDCKQRLLDWETDLAIMTERGK